jgi:hypothetical protein
MTLQTEFPRACHYPAKRPEKLEMKMRPEISDEAIPTDPGRVQN